LLFSHLLLALICSLAVIAAKVELEKGAVAVRRHPKEVPFPSECCVFSDGVAETRMAVLPLLLFLAAAAAAR
ncbi:hypothetical protein PFISCL1PPCAC_11816, partial [Pristionchus fissidentatus]